jgi:hypothetical protein
MENLRMGNIGNMKKGKKQSKMEKKLVQKEGV